ncbi:MAG: rod shape-determining protein MreC [Hyphomicrobiaceae bacterium]
MAILKHDSHDLIRRGGRSGRRQPLSVMLALLAFVAVALLMLSRLDHTYVRQFRSYFAEATAPVMDAAQDYLEPVRRAGRQAASYVELAGRIEELERRNQELESWRWRAKELERQLQDLSRVARVVHEEERPTLTARVIATSTGAFARSAIVNAGRAQLVRVGYPVVNGDGLVGRVVDAAERTSRVLLVTDINSRIPVHVGDTSVRALMVGDNGSRPRLTFISEGATIAAGMDVFTSGVGGLFPRGLRIGEVVATASGFAVAPRAALDTLEYLSVLFFASPALELTDQEGGVGTGRRAAAGSVGTSKAVP